MDEQEALELELYAPQAEAALIGAAGHHADVIASVLARVPGSDFWDPHRGYVWDACRVLSADRARVDPTSVARRLAADGHWNDATSRIVAREFTPGAPADFAGRDADTVHGMARRRELMQAITRARRTVLQHPGDITEVLAAVRAEFEADDVEAEPQGGPLGWDELIAEFREAHSPEAKRESIPTPWWELNEVLGGLFGGRMYVFGGRPGQGKSTAALNIAAHAAINQKSSVLVISKEMPSVDVTGRILARGAEVDLKVINSRSLDRWSMNSIDAYLDSVGRPKFFVDARPRKLAGVKALARTQAHRIGLDLLVVDYLQLVRTDTPSRTREQEVAQVSMELKALALELDCVVVVPAQLNRGSVQRADPKPTMSDLRDSGQIEQDSDVVTLLHRERTPDGTPTGKILLIVDKNRHGPTTEIKLDWRGGYGAIA